MHGSRAELAAMLGRSRPALNRTLNELTDSEMIQIRYRLIKLTSAIDHLEHRLP
ncbi:hypothetical protein GCM10009854_18240 [Saccharopolyspora halophila]|uniref:HTH crp-type domain-containing protein n=1 Tax=Saccharopolyspora halophila TaxID=405551 RepID=A0ABN3G1A1_9PSEU